MSAFLFYAAGVATPFVVRFFAYVPEMVADTIRWNRYCRAYKKFCSDWDALPPHQQRDFASSDKREPQYHYDRDAYFAHRWKHGQTTEI